ncbi:glutamine-hydrolyzing carbamoyl-phosphate synthase small subunit, partial [Candidatus Gottesmanbacteria bacterium]|nr:glutamine-hydrolyzing carbamoyl-phosphate synthase small subunit [Candidatus Gottesmanbacteria bacterium]
LILENGQILEGTSFGHETEVSGEVVFNTGMVGYPESFTDPSYYGQILVATYPLIGNYGVPTSDYFESTKIHIRGLIVSSYIESKSHHQAKMSLSDWLEKEGIPALSNIDTRTLTQNIRQKGVLKGLISFKTPIKSGLFYDINSDNLVAKVSIKKTEIYGNGSFKLLFIDCGAKLNQIRLLLKQKIQIIRVPWNYDPFGNTQFKFDAIMISNGPGDPKRAAATIKIVKEALARKIPILGICLGNQILALSAGANTYKLKFGHRGQNQPVADTLTGRCYITTHNHGFAVDTKSLPYGWKSWFINLNDNTNEGIYHQDLPFMSTQFHPEAAPGPEDTEWVIPYFIERAKKWLKK